MLHFVKSRRHFTFVKPNYINCFCFSHEVVVSKMRQFYGISYLVQRNTHVFAIFILRWNICSHLTKFTYFYKDIVGQKLYLVQGGNIIVELHMKDGTVVSLQSSMDGIITFLDTAFAAWCLQKGIDPQSCSFHDPSQSLWFPTVEDV